MNAANQRVAAQGHFDGLKAGNSENVSQLLLGVVVVPVGVSAGYLV